MKLSALQRSLIRLLYNGHGVKFTLGAWRRVSDSSTVNGNTVNSLCEKALVSIQNTQLVLTEKGREMAAGL